MAREKKTCTKCGEDKPLDAYYRDRGKSTAACKDCKRAQIYTKRDEDPESYREYQQVWRATNRARVNVGAAKYRAANREQIASAQRKARASEPERFRASKRRQYARNRDEIAAKTRAYYAENSERWKAYRLKRLAVSRSVPHVPYTRRQIYDRDDGRCQHCARTLEYGCGEAEVDHIVPVELGGWDVPGNLQLLCRPCNRRKWARLVFTNPARSLQI